MFKVWRLIFEFSSLGLYLYTIYLAYHLGSFFSAIMSACFPFLANLFWIYKIWDATGVLLSFYTLLCIAYLCIFVIHVLVIFLKEKGTEQTEE